MAYLRLRNSMCAAAGCKKRATKVLVDRWNSERGQYCTKCADKALARQKKNEEGS